MGNIVDISEGDRRRRDRRRASRAKDVSPDRSKTALVLTGGGFTGGVYQIGALRALDLAQLDESNRALQEQIWALQDQQKAADEAAAAAEKLRSAWTQITDSLLAEVARIRGSMDGGTKTYAQAMSEFNAATLAARAGDQEAAKSLPGLSHFEASAHGAVNHSSAKSPGFNATGAMRESLSSRPIA